MKKIKILLAALLVLLATFVATNIFSNNDDADDVVMIDHPIVGEWDSYQTFTWYYTFNADGTGLMTPDFEFTWNVADGVIWIQVEGDETETYWEYTVDGDSMTLVSTLMAGFELELDFFRTGTEPDLSDWDFDFDMDFDDEFYYEYDDEEVEQFWRTVLPIGEAVFLSKVLEKKLTHN